MRRIDDDKIKKLQKDGKEPKDEKGKAVTTAAKIPGSRRHRRKSKPGVKETPPVPATPEPDKVEAVKSLAQSIESVAKSSHEIVKTTQVMVDSVLVRLKQIRATPVDVKVDVKPPEPVKNKKKTIKCENIERDSKGYIESFELKEI